jgi:hypothetical protein
MEAADCRWPRQVQVRDNSGMAWGQRAAYTSTLLSFLQSDTNLGTFTDVIKVPQQLTVIGRLSLVIWPHQVSP